MRSWTSFWSNPLLRAALALAGLGLCALATARLALRERQPPERCPPGLSARGGRCCGVGQSLQAGECSGIATSCAATQDKNERGQCVARFGVVSFVGGELAIGAADWDGSNGTERFPRTHVAAFRLDVTEVTNERFASCAACTTTSTAEPGLPKTDVTPAEAEAFCQTLHGRLPSSAEWVWAAAGGSARRFPWGNSGLVCRRAAFGLVHGPCAELSSGGAETAELAGSRPDGASPDGILDLAGNVAEWTRDESGTYVARGGSFRSTSAAELKSWAALPDRKKALYIGFRCAYPP